MVVGHCTYLIKEGHAKDFIWEVKDSGFYEDARAESGNICYVPYYSAEDPDTVFVTECWRSRADISAHEKMPHLAKLNAVCEKYLISLTLEYHEVGQEYDKIVLTADDMTAHEASDPQRSDGI